TFKGECTGARRGGDILESYPEVSSAILVSSRGDVPEIEEFIKNRVDRYIRFGPEVPVPLKNLYRTPLTLGCDRMAAAVGASAVYPASNILIADLGTAITFDVVTAAGEFLGGNISPGAAMRLRALHRYTGRLPLVGQAGATEEIASSTDTALRSGVVNGIVYEIEGYISRLAGRYDPLKIIFTGGDSDFFAKRVKNAIFATYDLVVYGLNRILEYNAD
ncbi:MAG: type III pantothenate kinase, partial [Rikenellaceae bacterium]|nr:type III pantothenate kinase [Rikenellaceae bacterium]